MTLYPKLIEEALATVIYPGTKKNLIESEMLADTPSINGMKVKVVLLFPRDTDPFLKSTVKAAEAAIHYHISKEVEVEIVTEFKSAPRPEVGKMLPQVKNVIAVSSGKGGVGKSTVSANLADALNDRNLGEQRHIHFLGEVLATLLTKDIILVLRQLGRRKVSHVLD